MIEILKQGYIPPRPKYRGTCHCCRTEFRCDEKDGCLHPEATYLLLGLNCPNCGVKTNATPEPAAT